MRADLRQVSQGFDYRVGTFQKYDINGYRFRTASNEQSRPGRKTTNSGVLTVCNGVEYYGILEEIYELYYSGNNPPKVVVFKCHWFDPVHYRRNLGIGLVEIQRDKKLECEDVYIVAQQATQVYYLSYPCKKAKNLQDYDVVYNVSPHGKPALPNDEDYHPLLDSNTYDGDFFQEEDGLTGHFVIDLTEAQGMEVDNDGDGDDVEEEVEDMNDLAMLDRLHVHNDSDDDGDSDDAPFDDTRDSEDEADVSADPEQTYDPDDPDYDYNMYAF
jgi:hypothetical protein